MNMWQRSTVEYYAAIRKSEIQNKQNKKKEKVKYHCRDGVIITERQALYDLL